MQVGAIDVFADQPKDRNLKKELLMGLASSAVYTLVILALIQFNKKNKEKTPPRGRVFSIH
jgi:hypothetical protein